ncbi:MBOAT family O-acyltransferase [uncultured Thalassospira sp.]|uniref:MBOAT family O-acyltransferase n=1 Tax=uncultured Thalassospira sp. TaxID=404382 RepID=UPI0030DC26E4|tara:strand:+ start:5434 stop:6777 length:1344 start_codon:yes stop_codon:yes gene_type:complete
MLFQLPDFILFFGGFCFILSIVPKRFVKTYVLLGSVLFYSFWLVSDVFLLIILMIFSWVACRCISKNTKLLPFFIVISVLPLFYFKYANFFLHSIGLSSVNLQVHLPLGISFITFTLISMMVDLSRSQRPESSMLDTSAYISFFPHLIAGPILRTSQLIPQLDKFKVTRKNIIYNIPLFATGMVKKVFIADPIARYADPIFFNSGSYNSSELLVAAIGFSIQIYCDFSAYSDMAIAVAGMIGIDFPENFSSPYLSKSMREIWRRWHMTLSFWIRDYLFKPMYKKMRKSSPYLPFVLTMTLSGLWHGANWTFVVWGAVQGIIIALETYCDYDRILKRKWYLGCMGTFLNFSIWTFLLVIFRSSTLKEAFNFYSYFMDFNFGNISDGGMTTIILILVALSFHYFDQVDKIRGAFVKVPAFITFFSCLGLIVGGSFVASSHPQNFYYFDF